MSLFACDQARRDARRRIERILAEAMPTPELLALSAVLESRYLADAEAGGQTGRRGSHTA